MAAHARTPRLVRKLCNVRITRAHYQTNMRKSTLRNVERATNIQKDGMHSEEKSEKSKEVESVSRGTSYCAYAAYKFAKEFL